MDEVDVDVVGLEVPQAGLDGEHCATGAAVTALLERRVVVADAPGQVHVGVDVPAQTRAQRPAIDPHEAPREAAGGPNIGPNS